MIRTNHRLKLIVALLLQLLPVLWICRDFVFKGEYILSPETIEMSLPWAQRLDEIGWNLEEALWDPTSFFGMPFLANPSLRGLYPIDLFLRLLTPASPESLFNWLIFIHLWLIGMGGFMWISRTLHDFYGGILAGWILIGNGYILSRVGLAEPGFLITSTWIPWILWIIRDRLSLKKSIFLIIFLILLFLSGRPDLAFYTCLLILVHEGWIWFPRIFGSPYPTRMINHSCILLFCLVCAGTIVLIQYGMTAELKNYSANRTEGKNYSFAATDSMEPHLLLVSLFPGCLGNIPEAEDGIQSKSPEKQIGLGIGIHEIYFFMGMGTLFLLMRGILSRGIREKWFWLFILVITILTSFGKYGYLHRLFFEIIPFWGSFRVPPRILIFTVIAGTYLSALGLKLRFKKKQAGKMLVVTLGGVLAGSLVYGFSPLLIEWLAKRYFQESGLGQNTIEIFKRLTHFHLSLFQTSVMTGVLLWIGYGVLATLACWLNKNQMIVIAKPAVITLILIELIVFNSGYIHGVSKTEIERCYPKDPLVERFKTDFDPNNPTRLLILGDTMLYFRRPIHPWFFPGRFFAYRIETANGYTPFVLEQHINLFRAIAPEQETYNGGLLLYLMDLQSIDRRLFSWLNVSHVLTGSKPPDDFPILDSHVYIDDKNRSSRVFLCKSPYCHPRVFLYRQISEGVLPEPDPNLGSARIHERTPLTVVIDAECKYPCHLALLDTWYPGWTCTIDGNPEEIRQITYTYRSVPLPPGNHRIEMRFKGLSWLGPLSD